MVRARPQVRNCGMLRHRPDTLAWQGLTLIVVHDRWRRTALANLLRDADCPVSEASNGMAALRLIEQTPPALLVVDGALPELSGAGLVAALAEQPHGRRTRVLFLEPASMEAPASPEQAGTPRPTTRVASMRADGACSGRPPRRPSPDGVRKRRRLWRTSVARGATDGARVRGDATR